MSEVSGNGLNSGLNALLARVPSIERIMSSAALQPSIDAYGRTQVLAAVRATLDNWRSKLQAEASNTTASPSPSALPEAATLDEAHLAADVARTLAERAQSRLRTVFNLTGTVLHTNLGRALLPDEAVQAVVEALTRPASLEFDLATGRRGDRDDLIDELICELTGAEAAGCAKWAPPTAHTSKTTRKRSARAPRC